MCRQVLAEEAEHEAMREAAKPVQSHMSGQGTDTCHCRRGPTSSSRLGPKCLGHHNTLEWLGLCGEPMLEMCRWSQSEVSTMGRMVHTKVYGIVSAVAAAVSWRCSLEQTEERMLTV